MLNKNLCELQKDDLIEYPIGIKLLWSILWEYSSWDTCRISKNNLTSILAKLISWNNFLMGKHYRKQNILFFSQ